LGEKNALVTQDEGIDRARRGQGKEQNDGGKVMFFPRTKVVEIRRKGRPNWSRVLNPTKTGKRNKSHPSAGPRERRADWLKHIQG